MGSEMCIRDSSSSDDGSLTTEEGHKVRNHGSKDAATYLGDKGHTPDSVDAIFGEGSKSGSDGRHDNASGQAKTPTTVTVGANGDWARENNETGDIIQVNDKNNPDQPIPEIE